MQAKLENIGCGSGVLSELSVINVPLQIWSNAVLK